MFDFRYHALSLVAVFLALGIGILLGATIGDSLVSEAGRGLSSSLHQDVVNARNDAEDVRSQLDQRDRIIKTVLPTLVQNELNGQRVAVVGTGALPGSVESALRQAIETAGGSVDSVSVLSLKDQQSDIESAAGVHFAGSGTDTSLLEPLGRRTGQSILRAGGIVKRLQRAQPDAFRGDLTGATAVALYHSPPPEKENGDEKKARQTFETAVVQGMQDEQAPIVGVEETGTDPSQVSWYKDRKVASVDSVDLPGGQVALVFALTGEKGAFGLKPGSDSPLPKLPVGATGG